MVIYGWLVYLTEKADAHASAFQVLFRKLNHVNGKYTNIVNFINI